MTLGCGKCSILHTRRSTVSLALCPPRAPSSPPPASQLFPERGPHGERRVCPREVASHVRRRPHRTATGSPRALAQAPARSSGALCGQPAERRTSLCPHRRTWTQPRSDPPGNTPVCFRCFTQGQPDLGVMPGSQRGCWPFVDLPSVSSNVLITMRASPHPQKPGD